MREAEGAATMASMATACGGGNWEQRKVCDYFGGYFIFSSF